VMDELSEANRRIGELERQMDTMRQHGDNAATVAEKSDHALAGMIAELSSQVRSIADKLNGTGGADSAN
jgi:cell division protein ZapA